MPCYDDRGEKESKYTEGLLCELLKCVRYGKPVPKELQSKLETWYDGHCLEDQARKTI